MALWGVGPLGQLSDDPDAYRRIAETLASTGVFGVSSADGDVDPTAFRPPLYPWLLSWMVSESDEGKAQLNLIACGLFQAVLGAVTAAATAKAVSCWMQNEIRSPMRAGLVAGLLVAIDPILLMQSTLVMTETLATAIAAVAWMWITLATSLATSNVVDLVKDPLHLENGEGSLTRSATPEVAGSQLTWWNWIYWILASLFLALGFLCRPTFVVWTLGLIGLLLTKSFWILIRKPTQRSIVWQAFGIAGLIAIMTGVTIGAWMERNRQVIGQPVWATTHGGYTLLLGNNPFFYDYLRSRSFMSAAVWGDAWDAESFHQEWQVRLDSLRTERVDLPQLDTEPIVDQEVWADRLASTWAWDTIRADRTMFVYSSLVRIARLWSPFPRVGQQVSMVSLGLGVYYIAVYVGCLVAIFRFGRNLFRWQSFGVSAGLNTSAGLSALMLVLSLTVVHAVYWSNVRMRAPAMPVILGLAALSVAGGLKAPLGRGEH